MTVNRRLLNWGVFFVAAGGVLIAAQGDVIGDDGVTQALRLWPVLVIALGVGLLLRRTRLGIAGGMLAAAVAGLLLGGVLVAAPVAVANVGPACNGVRPTSLESHQGTFGGPASVDLRLVCGELNVGTGPGTGWRVDAGNGTGISPVVDASTDRLVVSSSVREPGIAFVRGADTLNLTLPVASPLDVATEVVAGHGRLDLAGARLGTMRLVVNAGEGELDLEQASLEHLSVSVNMGSASLRLPAQDFDADLSVDAGALRICAPADLGLRIRQDGALSSATYTGLLRLGETWESPSYSTAAHHADVTISANVASVDVNPIGGCK